MKNKVRKSVLKSIPDVKSDGKIVTRKERREGVNRKVNKMVSKIHREFVLWAEAVKEPGYKVVGFEAFAQIMVRLEQFLNVRIKVDPHEAHLWRRAAREFNGYVKQVFKEKGGKK